MTDDRPRLEDLRSRVVRIIREKTGLHEQFALPIAAEIIATFWHEVAGERVYVPSRDPDLAAKVVAEFNGNNRDELMRKYEISRPTFYRIVARARPRPSGAPPPRDDFSL